ncbi:hypothetical protein LA535_004902 [Salmonella enterica]|uniref:Lipoprotein n=2 Tax=Salmonella enterica TaxID=28901 RepID=A0A5Z4WVC4_SALER|nr:hypothetical protein [Salmonella enterica subsp. enterica serovar Pensacola]EAQ4578589.1 hypothetical protein [Salmonella enterica]EDQ0313174.1 hypothetical protein [Salmonella enterica subsp. enterica serovar Berta]EDV7396978.1 hypothetical protein [Salmonella enterica subsp. enterica]EAV2407658.1 hypothetical protein [Salmonella enterica]
MKSSITFSFLLVLTVIITGCSSGKSKGDYSLVDGIYFWGQDISVFQPCHTHQIYWLNGEKNTLRSLKKHHNTNKSVYASLIVHNDAYQDKGPSGTYDETLMLEKIISIDNSENHVDCLNFIIPSKKTQSYIQK